jgi:hypothetical protein
MSLSGDAFIVRPQPVAGSMDKPLSRHVKEGEFMFKRLIPGR